MSKVIAATCDAQGKVTADGVEVVGATVLSLGTKASSGLLVIDGTTKFYFPSNATDVKDLIEKVVAIVDKVVTIATGLDGVTNSPGAQAANIVLLTTLKTQLNATKDTIK